MTGAGGGSPQHATLAWPRPDDQAVFRAKLLWRERGEAYRDWRARLGLARTALSSHDRPVRPAAGTVAIGAVAHLLVTAIEEGRDQSSMSGILAGPYRLLLA